MAGPLGRRTLCNTAPSREPRDCTRSTAHDEWDGRGRGGGGGGGLRVSVCAGGVQRRATIAIPCLVTGGAGWARASAVVMESSPTLPHPPAPSPRAQVALDPVAQDAPDAPDAPDADDADDAAAPGGPRDVDWRAVAQATLALPELQLEKTSKRGKTQYFDARRQLLGLEHVPEAQLPAHKGFALPLEPGTAVLRVRGTAVVTGAPGILTMASILKLLEAGGAGPVRMVHTHRESCKVEPLPELPDDVKAEWRALEAKWAEQKRLREAGEPLRTYKWEDGIIFCYD